MKIFTAQKSFSLLELTVTLAIIAIILTMSAIGLVALRENFLGSSATQALFNNINLTQSMAQNNYSVIKDGELVRPDVYILNRISESQYAIQGCFTTISSLTTLNIDSYDECVTIINDIFEGSISGAKIVIDNSELAIDYPDFDPCYTVGFLSQTGDLYYNKAIETEMHRDANRKCIYQINSPNNTTKQYIGIYPDINEFKKL